MKRKSFMFYCFMFLALVFAVGGGYLLINNFVGSEIEKEIENSTDAGDSTKTHIYYLKVYLSDNRSTLYDATGYSPWTGGSGKMRISSIGSISLSIHSASLGDNDKVTLPESCSNLSWEGTNAGSKTNASYKTTQDCKTMGTCVNSYKIDSYQSNWAAWDVPYTSLISTIKFNVNVNNSNFEAYYDYSSSSTRPSLSSFSSCSGTCYSSLTSSNSTSDQTNNMYIHVWISPKQYTATFNLNGGNINGSTVNQDKSIFYGSYYTLPTAPTRTGYTFAGWWTAKTGGSQITSSNYKSSSGNETFYAHWTPNEYTLSFDANGGSVGTTSKTIIYDSTYGDLPASPNVYRTGYTFAGWWTEKTGGSQVYSLTKVDHANNKTVYAHWNINSYTVSVTAGTGISSVSGGGSYTYGSIATINCNLKTGYHFVNWTGSDTKTTQSFSITVGAQNYSFTANGVPNTYTVRYNGNGATSGSMSNQGFTYDSAQNLRANGFSRTGYTFTGWKVDYYEAIVFEDGTGVSSSGEFINDSGWYTNREFLPIETSGKEVTFTTNYRVCGIYAYDQNQNFIKRCSSYATTHTVPYNTKYIRVEVNKSDLAFASRGNLRIVREEIFENNKNVKNLTSTNGGIVNLYAQWRANTYTVTANPNSGKINYISLSNITSGSTYSGVKVEYDKATNILTLNGTANGSILFGRQYMGVGRMISGHKFTITSKLVSGSASGNGCFVFEPYNINDSVVSTRNQCDFTYQGNDNKSFTINSASQSEGEYFLFWLWCNTDTRFNNAKYHITVTNSNSTNLVKSVQYDGLYNLSATAYRPGYTFNGWYTATTTGSEIKDPYKTTSSSTVYARYTLVTYNIILHANNGSNSTTSKTATYSTLISALNTFTNNGKIFSGWSTSSSGSVMYQEGSISVSSILNTINDPRKLYGADKTIDLYAVWQDTFVSNPDNRANPSGLGTYNSPYIIENYKHLAWLSYEVNVNKNNSVYAKQTADIIFPENMTTWYPIGTKSTPFSGNYNGQKHLILNLKVDLPNVDGVGMFGYIGAGFVSNTVLFNVSITGRYDAGAIAGVITGYENDDGEWDWAEIYDCYIEGNVSSSDDTGGIVGEIGDAVYIFRCIVKVNLISRDDDQDYMGAVFGFISGGNEVYIWDIYAECEDIGSWYYEDTGDNASIDNVVYVTANGRGYVNGTFSNFTISASGTPIPKGFTWLEKANSESASLDYVKNWCNG